MTPPDLHAVAIEAMKGLLAGPWGVYYAELEKHTELAKDAYSIAHAMDLARLAATAGERPANRSN